jgi:Spy/CpxP family protein refolding chaperone
MKIIKTRTILLLAFLCLTGIALSQPMGPPPKDRADRQQEKKDNIEAMKIAFLTKQLDLTPEEAQKFWPVYNQYQDRLHELRKQRRLSEKDAKKNIEELSDKELEQAIDNDFATRQKELDLQKEYNEKFKAVLPIRKVSKLYAAEEQFKMVLLDKLKNKPMGRD